MQEATALPTVPFPFLLLIPIIFLNLAFPNHFFIFITIQLIVNKIGVDWIQTADLCGQSYKHITLVNYDSRVVPDWKIPHIKTLES